MSLLPSRAKTLAVVLMMLFSQQAVAKQEVVDVKVSKEVRKVVRKQKHRTPDEIRQDRVRLETVRNRVNQVFTLLGGEMALQKGYAGISLATYLMMLERTKSPEVAERALEIAVSLNAFEQAEAVYQKWREIEPVPGEAQKRMTWLRNLLLGQNDQNLDGLEHILEQASDEQNRRVFLLLAQAAVKQPGLAEKAAKQVHKAAAKYGDMPEAAIADAVFSVQSKDKAQAIEALQRLAKLDDEMLPPTLLTLRLAVQKYPEILDGFFEQTDTKNLSPVWQELEIVNLISARRLDDAHARLNVLLEAKPSAELYMQAAALAAGREENVFVIEGYLEKAYQIGTKEQQNKAAMIAAITNRKERNYHGIEKWLKRVSLPEYRFDKGVVAAVAELEIKGSKAALRKIREVQKYTEKQGKYFDQRDLYALKMFTISRIKNQQEALLETNKLIGELKRGEYEDMLADTFQMRALKYDALGNRSKAVADLRRALELSPDDARMMNNLGYMLLSERNSLEEAFRLLQTAYQINPDDIAVNDSIGWAYHLKGDSQTALPYVEYSFEKVPEPETAAHLGEILWRLGETERAVKIWTKGAALDGDKKVLDDTLKKFDIVLPQEFEDGMEQEEIQ